MRVLVSCVLFIWMFACDVHAAQLVEDGRLDLRERELTGSAPVGLGGGWHFYEGVFLKPDQLTAYEYKVIQAPATWGSQGMRMGNQGHGTYHLVIGLSDEEVGRTLGLELPGIASAYDLYINGHKLASVGQIGTSPDGMQPAILPRVLYFTPDSDQLDLILHVSNYSQRKGGMWAELRLGSADSIAREQQHRLIFQGFIASGLLLMGIIHVGLYAFRLGLTALFFGLACLLLFLRSVFVGEMIAMQLLPSIPWEMAVKIEYLSVYWGIGFLVLYIHHLYPKDLRRAISYALVGLMFVCTLPVLVLPARIYTEWLIGYQLIVLVLILYILYGLFRAVLRRRFGAVTNLAAGLLFFASAINDILYYNFLLRSIDLVTFGLFIFIFTQMMMLAKRYVYTYRQASELKVELEATNANLERLVEERTEALQRSNQRLKQAEQARTDLLSDIVHELRNPLTSVIGYLRRLKDGLAADLAERHVEVAYQKALMLNHVVEDLRQLAHMEQHEIAYQHQPMEVRELFSALDMAYDWELLDRQVERRWQLPRDGDEYIVHVDRMRLEQAFANLVTNALVHTKKRESLTISGRCYRFARVCVIAVKDTGSGIARAEQANLFNRFYRARQAGADTQHAGSGLGLAIAKAIMDAHQGRIGMRSKLGRGSTFYLIFPVEMVGIP